MPSERVCFVGCESNSTPGIGSSRLLGTTRQTGGRGCAGTNTFSRPHPLKQIAAADSVKIAGSLFGSMGNILR